MGNDGKVDFSHLIKQGAHSYHILCTLNFFHTIFSDNSIFLHGFLTNHNQQLYSKQIHFIQVFNLYCGLSILYFILTLSSTFAQKKLKNIVFNLHEHYHQFLKIKKNNTHLACHLYLFHT